jgi:glutaminase
MAGSAAAAFREAFADASTVAGGSVYTDQDVRGLSDQDPDAPLVATLQLCGSAEQITLVADGAGGAVDGGSDGSSSAGRRRFLAQSCFKPLSYAMALEHGLGDEVAAAVGCTGDVAFGTFDRAADGRALNPLINSGALAVLELLSRTHSVDQVGSWCRGVGGAADAAAPLYDAVAVAATEADSLRNRGLSSALAAAGVMPKTDEAVDRAVRYYAALDCLSVTTVELAAVATAFAGGASAGTGVTLSAGTRSATLATMLHCGMYEASGDWSVSVGVPAKSGVSGAVWAAIPGDIIMAS